MGRAGKGKTGSNAGQTNAAVPLVPRAMRIRMAPQDRERLIVEHAMRFFAEQGLEGQTRELARRLGITQSLLYRYFPSKDALIERVYEKWFNELWNPSWQDWIVDRSAPLEERLVRLYRDYVHVIYNYEWVRLFSFSGLNGLSYHARFVARNREQLFMRIAAELRYDYGMPPLTEISLTEFEIELLWSMHATSFYVGQRRWVYGLPVPADVNAFMEARVHSFMATAPQQIATYLGNLPAAKLAGD